MAKKLPPVHPGEVLREEYLVPMKLAPYSLAKALGIPRTRIERHVRQRPIGQQMPVAHIADDGFELDDLRVRDVFGLAADEHPLQRRTILQMLE